MPVALSSPGVGNLPLENRCTSHGRNLVVAGFFSATQWTSNSTAPGGVLVSPELRAAASLAKEVTLLGMGNHFELWDAETYAEKEKAAMAQGMPDALKNFTF